MIEKILREATKNVFSDKWYQKVSRKVSRKILEEKPKDIDQKNDQEIVNVFNRIKKANNQHNGEWLPIYEIKERINSDIGNQKLGQILSKNGFRSKSMRFKGGNPVKCYYIKLYEAAMV